MKFGMNDIGDEKLGSQLLTSSSPELLEELVCISRREFGWFTKQDTRPIEYTWILEQMRNVKGKAILDIGAGVSPLPLYLVKHGGAVTTVDKSPIIRMPRVRSHTWNEWGYLNYSLIDSRLSSLCVDMNKARFRRGRFDIAYSVSVVEHMHSVVRRRLWANLGTWIKGGGTLLITLDLIPETDDLWNRDRGKQLEETSRHGSIRDIISELATQGLALVHRETRRDPSRSWRTDIALLHFSKEAARDPRMSSSR
jgi:SAM-dependent methyltransferase